MHRRYALPIGKWEDLKVKGTEVFATPVFDESSDDELAKIIASKVKGGFLRAASMGTEVLETSSDPKDLLPGQTRSTITRCRLKEISIVDIPSNSNALQVQLFAGDVPATFSDVLPKINYPEMEKINVALGLDANTSEQNALTAIKALQDSLTKKTQDAKQVLLALGKLNGTITEQNEASMMALAEKDFANTLALVTLAAKPKAEDPTKENPTDPPTVNQPSINELLLSLKGSNQGNKDDRSDWTLKDWQTKDGEGLKLMSQQDPDKFQAILKRSRN